MASRGVTTDLVIRATEIKTKPLDDLLVTLGRLTTALDALGAEGGPASKSLQELTNEARKFEQVSAELTGRRALFEVFSQAQQGAKLAGAAAEEARKKLEAFNSITPAKGRTDDQKEQYTALSAAVKEAEKSFRAADKALGTAEGKLQRIGVTAAQASDELVRLVQADEQAAAGFERATRNAQGYHEALRQKKTADKDAAAAALESAAASKRAEQADHDRLALLEQVGRAQQQARGQTQAQSELQGIAEYEAALKRERVAQQERAQAIADSTKALAAQRAAEQQAAQDLRAHGIAAQEAAKGTDTLVTAARKLASSSGGATTTLAQEVGAIVDPTRRAAMAMSEIEAELVRVTARQKEAESAFKLFEPALKQLAADHTFLAQALRETERQAGAIEGFKRANAEFAATGQAIDRARAALEQYAAQARAAGTSDAALEEGLRKQKAELDALVAAYQRQAGSVAAAGAKAREAGVDLNDLAAAEQKVVQQAHGLRGAMDAASSSTTKLGQATTEATKSAGKWGEEQRTALSLSQRVRGQILSLTAAYVGLFGVINEAKASLDAVTSLGAVNNRLEVAFGKDAPGELERIRKEADRLGIGLQGAAEGYSRFAIAARAGGATADETFFIFSKFSEVSRVFKLGAEEQKRVFKALEQMMSKGKISAEELGQQLGDSLPGAMDKMAKAMKMSPAELFKAMEKGQVSSRNLLLLAREYGDSVQNQVVPASKSWQSELQRLETALFNFRTKVGMGGFAEEMGTLSRAISEALSSKEGASAAQAMSDIFSLIAQALALAVPVVVGFGSAIGDAVAQAKEFAASALGMANSLREMAGYSPATPVKDLTAALKELGAFLAQGLIVAAGVALFNFAAAALAAQSAIMLFGKAAWAVLAGAEGVAGAAIVAKGGIDLLTDGWSKLNVVAKGFILLSVFQVFKSIGDWAYESLLAVRLLGAALVGTGNVLANLATLNMAGAKAAHQEAVDYSKALIEENRKSKNKPVTQASVDGSKLTSQEMARRGGQSATAKKAAEDRARGQAAQFGKDASAADTKKLAGFEPVLLNAEKKTGKSDAEKAAEKYAHLLKSVEKGVDALELRGMKHGANDLEDALAAVDKQYEGLYETISKLSAKDAAAMTKRADAAKASVKDDVRLEFARKEAAAKVTALLEERDALLDVAKAQAEVNPAKALEAQQEQIRITTRYKEEILAAAEAALVLAEGQKKVVEAAKLQALITKTKAFDPEAEMRKARIEDLQKALKAEMEIRDAKIAAATAQVSQVDPTGKSAESETKRILGEFNTGLAETATKIRDLAVSGGDFPLIAQMDTLLVKLREVDPQLQKIQGDLVSTFQGGMTGALTTGYSALTDWITGVGSFGDAWVKARDGFRSFAADFLMNIVKMIAQQQALNIAQSLMGGGQSASFVGPQQPGLMSQAGSWLSGLLTMHNGGVVGGANGWSQSAPAIAFAGAQRFHGGGLPGLKADEVPTILQKGEEVLAKDNPRNVLNGGGGQAGGTPATAQQPFTIVNTFNPEEVVAAGLSDRAFVNYVAANKTAVKKLLA
jgi:tape measure domain-containing protein